jgi:hypothetical protein
MRPGNGDDFDVVVAEHDAMVLRTEIVETARRQHKPEAAEGFGSQIKVLHGDDDVIYAFDVFAHGETVEDVAPL